MASTDTLIGKGEENSLRMAMDRASDVVGNIGRRYLDRPRSEDPIQLAESQIVERNSLQRVKVKVEILGYIDAQFRQRTSSDGTILAVSREQLVEDLTNLVMRCEAELFDKTQYAAPDGTISVKKPMHNREPAKVD